MTLPSRVKLAPWSSLPRFANACMWHSFWRHMQDYIVTVGAPVRQYGWYDPIGARTIGKDQVRAGFQYPGYGYTQQGAATRLCRRAGYYLAAVSTFFLFQLYSSVLYVPQALGCFDRSLFLVVCFVYYDGVVS
jgi:hypothetical protein